MTCMHGKNPLAVWIAFTFLLAASPVFAEIGSHGSHTQKSYAIGDPFAGKEKSHLCQGCHGEDGNSLDEEIPKLAGQFEKYLSKQLYNFRDGLRFHVTFDTIASSLSYEDLDNIAAYYSNLARMRGKESTPNSQGKHIFMEGDLQHKIIACVTCHGVRGKGLSQNITMFPVIGGQHKAYLMKQLMDFRADNRTNSPSSIMNRIAKTLSDKEIEALAEYLSAQ